MTRHQRNRKRIPGERKLMGIANPTPDNVRRAFMVLENEKAKKQPGGVYDTCWGFSTSIEYFIDPLAVEVTPLIEHKEIRCVRMTADQGYIEFTLIRAGDPAKRKGQRKTNEVFMKLSGVGWLKSHGERGITEFNGLEEALRNYKSAIEEYFGKRLNID